MAQYKKTIKSLLLIICIVVTSFSCSRIQYFTSGGEDVRKTNQDDYFNKLSYNELLKLVSSVNLYSDRDAYDSLHFLMVPMYYAFNNDDKDIISCFDKIFKRFIDGCDGSPSETEQSLKNSQWYYLCSEYLVLQQKHQHHINNTLFKKVFKYAKEYKSTHKGNWTDYKQYDNFIDLLNGLLYGDGYESGNSYNNIIVDSELEALGIICDIAFIRNSNNLIKEQLKDENWIDQIIRLSDEVIKLQGKFDGNYWNFQIGMWDDHSEYAYAGYSCLDEIKNPYKRKPLRNVSWDSSHFFRMPLLLESIKRVQNDDEFYNNVEKGLANQFIDKVMICPTKKRNYWLANNYMDGRNGVYRYNPDNQTGWDRSCLTVSVLMGWWAFCGSDRISEMYRDLYEFVQSGKALPYEYTDHVSTRERYSVFLSRKWSEMLCYMASRINSGVRI